MRRDAKVVRHYIKNYMVVWILGKNSTNNAFDGFRLYYNLELFMWKTIADVQTCVRMICWYEFYLIHLLWWRGIGTYDFIK